MERPLQESIVLSSIITTGGRPNDPLQQLANLELYCCSRGSCLLSTTAMRTYVAAEAVIMVECYWCCYCISAYLDFLISPRHTISECKRLPSCQLRLRLFLQLLLPLLRCCFLLSSLSPLCCIAVYAACCCLFYCTYEPLPFWRCCIAIAVVGVVLLVEGKRV